MKIIFKNAAESAVEAGHTFFAARVAASRHLYAVVIVFILWLFFLFYPSSPAMSAEYYEVSLNSLVFVDTDIQKVIESFSRVTRYNIFLDETVPEKRVTFFARNMPVKLALEMFAKTNGLMLKKMNENTFLVYPRAKAAEYESETVSHVFILENDDPKKVINILKTIGKNTKVSLNERINGIVMIDTPENIETAKKIVAGMDYKKPQVTVDLKLVEVKRDRLKDLGVKFKQDSHAIINLKSLATLKDQVLIDTLIKENAAEVLAQPSLKVLDQQKAEIQVGDKIPIEITSASKTAAGDSVQLNKTVQWESVGIKLQIQVEKIHNENEVTLKIYNEVSSVVEYTKEGYPHIRTRNAVTVVRLNSNETAVIGGLINSEERTTVFKIPLLSTLPGLGKIFRNVRTDKISTEIVMFITPQISRRNETHTGKLHAELLEKAENRSFEVSETSLGIIDKNTDYYKETFSVSLPGEKLLNCGFSINNTGAAELRSNIISAAKVNMGINTWPLKHTCEIEAVSAASIPASALSIETDSVEIKPYGANPEFSGRSDYNERLKMILNKIKAVRYGLNEKATSSVIIDAVLPFK